MIVADSGPIITFARANNLLLLKSIVKKLVIPLAVYKEIVLDGKGKPGEKEVKTGTWIRRESIADATQLASLPSTFGAGEKEAILLARERSAFLLIDEYKPRKEATELSRPPVSVCRLCPILPAVKAGDPKRFPFS